MIMIRTWYTNPQVIESPIEKCDDDEIRATIVSQIRSGGKTMTLTLDHPEAAKLLHELMDYTGETEIEAVIEALRERLERERQKQVQHVSLKEALLDIGRTCAALPVLDHRSPDEIIGYDAHGVPA
jgi:antitoxin VapB